MERNRIDMTLLITTLFLVGLGSVMIYSASFVIAEEMFHGESSFFLKRHLVRVGLGIGLLVFFVHLDYRRLRKWSLIMVGIGFLCLVMVFIPGLGLTIRGATRTLKLWVLNFQPAEFVKVALVLFLAHWLEKHHHIIRKFVSGLLPGLVMIGIPFVLIAMQPDFGTAIALALTAVVMLYIGGARVTHLLGVGALAIPFLCVKLYVSPHSRLRILTYFDRLLGNSDQLMQGVEYQLKQSLISLGTGGFFGSGLGQSHQKFLFLPDPHTDFIFSVIGEELGFIGAITVLGLFMILTWRGIRIARQASDAYGFYLATGLTVLIAVHVLLNVGVVTGLLPTTGLPLPFISYGGSWLLLCMVSMGILLNISRGAARRQRVQYE